MEFYSLKHRRTIDVPEKDVRKRRMQRTTSSGKPQERYAITAETTVDGQTVKLSKFVNREAFDALAVPEVKG
jgi:hypothetical protein